MPYADTDFFIALMKQGDRYGGSARSVYKKYKGRIWMSLAVVIELMLVAKRTGIHVEQLVKDVLDIARVDGVESEKILLAAHLVDEKKAGVFDSIHSALSMHNEIISSDHIYDSLGIKRIPLEAAKS